MKKDEEAFLTRKKRKKLRYTCSPQEGKKTHTRLSPHTYSTSLLSRSQNHISAPISTRPSWAEHPPTHDITPSLSPCIHDAPKIKHPNHTTNRRAPPRAASSSKTAPRTKTDPSDQQTTPRTRRAIVFASAATKNNNNKQNKNITGRHSRMGSTPPPLLRGPGWVV